MLGSLEGLGDVYKRQVVVVFAHVSLPSHVNMRCVLITLILPMSVASVELPIPSLDAGTFLASLRVFNRHSVTSRSSLKPKKVPGLLAVLVPMVHAM